MICSRDFCFSRTDFGFTCIFFPKAFREAIKLAVKYKENSTDFMDEVLRELEVLANYVQFNALFLNT